MLSNNLAKALLAVDQKISELEKLKGSMNPEIKALELYTETIRSLKSPSPERVDDLSVRSNETSGHLARIEQELRSLQLKKELITAAKSTCYERIILGDGIAGTAVFSELPIEPNQDGLPSVLVLSDPQNTNQWPKDGKTLMGQEAFVQTQVHSSRSYDYTNARSSTRNPYLYVMADDFTKAHITTQNDLGMPILNLKAIRIESKENPNQNANWEHAEYSHRIVVSINNEEKHLYTKHIDICTGPGISRKLTVDQIDPALAQELERQNKLIYGQDQGDAKCEGTVVFYGGGAKKRNDDT